MSGTRRIKGLYPDEYKRKERVGAEKELILGLYDETDDGIVFCELLYGKSRFHQSYEIFDFYVCISQNMSVIRPPYLVIGKKLIHNCAGTFALTPQ